MADLGAQIYIDGAWIPVSVLVENGCTISGGVQKDAQVADPMVGRLSLRNDDGDLSARNPRSSKFGKLGRNTPARAHVPDAVHLWLVDNASSSYTLDHASLDIVGDLDVRADVQPLHWQCEQGVGLAAKYVTGTNQRSWAWWVNSDGKIVLRWTTDGTLATAIDVTSTAAIVPAADNRISLRATLDVNNGASGYTVTFYTGTGGVNGSWTQLGSTVTAGPVTSIFSGTAHVNVGGINVTQDATAGRMHAAQIRSGIGGTIVANPDFTAQTAGATSFVDSAGRTWQLNSGAELRNFDVRISGKVANWPTKWVTSGRKKWAPIEIGGPLRDLARPRQPLRDPICREATKVANKSLMVGYWPGTDGSDATQLASGIGGPSMAVVGTAVPDFASSDRFPGSDPVLTLAAGVSLQVTIPTHTGTGVIAYRMLADPGLTGWAADAPICRVITTGGTVRTWQLEVSNLGGLRLRGLDATNTEVANSNYISFDIWNRRQMIGWQVTQQGANIYWQIFTRRIANDLSVSEVGLDGTFNSLTVGRSGNLVVAPLQNLDGGGIGHIMLGTSVSLADTLDAAIVGNNGERAARRMDRLAGELGIPFRVVGHPDDTEPMGPQKSGKALELFETCAKADGGLLGEAREQPMLEYRTRWSLYNQRARATLTYGTAGESPDLEPDEPIDDVVNDFTATRQGGSFYQAVQTTGRLSTQDFPNGVGLRDEGETFNVQTDLALFGVAWWAVHLGTWDEYRHPKVKFNLTKLVDNGKTRLARSIAMLGAGDRFVINAPPSDLPPDPIDLLAQGWSEEIKPGRRFISFNTSPGRPWLVGVVGVDLVDSDGTTLVSGLSAVTPGTSQAVSVNVVGTPWSTSADVPFVMQIELLGMPAERVTVTGISGASSPQTMTITRGLDGFTRAHAAGAALTMYQPLRWAR